MPPSERAPSRRPADGEYTYRRRLRGIELLPAIAVGIAAGLMGFYVARLLLQRTPLRVSGAQANSAERLRRA